MNIQEQKINLELNLIFKEISNITHSSINTYPSINDEFKFIIDKLKINNEYLKLLRIINNHPEIIIKNIDNVNKDISGIKFVNTDIITLKTDDAYYIMAYSEYAIKYGNHTNFRISAGFESKIFDANDKNIVKITKPL